MKHEEPESYEILNAVEINEGKKVTRTRKRKKNTANDNLNVNFQVQSKIEINQEAPRISRK